MKEVTILVPEGKRAEWINGNLTLVDEPKVDNRPVTERIKTFADAIKELCLRANAGDDNAANIIAEYESNKDNLLCPQTLAYMRLSIIAAALNEGWEPKFTDDDIRYFPWFYFYTKEQYDELDEEEKRDCVLRSGSYTNSFYGFVSYSAHVDASYPQSSFGSRLAFRTRELAVYAGKQFIEEWADFMFKPRTGEELNRKTEVEHDKL